MFSRNHLLQKSALPMTNAKKLRPVQGKFYEKYKTNCKLYTKFKFFVAVG